MSSWDSCWDTGTTLKVRLTDGSTVELPITGCVLFDTDGDLGAELNVKLDSLFPDGQVPGDDGSLQITLASKSRSLRWSERQGVYLPLGVESVRDLDDSDVWDFVGLNFNSDRVYPWSWLVAKQRDTYLQSDMEIPDPVAAKRDAASRNSAYERSRMAGLESLSPQDLVNRLLM